MTHSIGPLDSNIFGGLHTTEKHRTILGEHGMLERCLLVEATVAMAQAELGIVPTTAAEAIARVTIGDLDIEAIGARTVEVGYPVVGLVEQLSKLVPDGNGHYVHWGLTTQDIMDTALILQIQSSLNVIEADVVTILQQLIRLADTHRNTLMIGRSQGQQALPVTFGHRVSAWLDAVVRHLERLDDLRPRVEVVQIGGAVGTLASLAPDGLEIRTRAARSLGLGLPTTSWHATRDRLVEVVMWTAQLCASLAKIGLDVALQAQSEVAEVHEASLPGRGVSSTMPHKRNQIGAQQLIRSGRLTRSYVDLMLDGAVADHDRATAAWSLEWSAVAPSLACCGGATDVAANLLTGLTVDSDAMTRNVEITNGLVMAEAVMMHLAPKVGRPEAHNVVDALVQRSLETNVSFSSLVETELPEASSSVDPTQYLGHVEEQIDATIDHARNTLNARS